MASLIQINHSLLPLSWLFGAGVAVRNWMFDKGILKSESYPIPIINVGNITVGGTGKTPHVEYLIRLLSERYEVAVLSRGYKRKSKGYLLADEQTEMSEIGDEPWQMKQKFPQVHVAVDANRREGIRRLMTDERTRGTQVILLDDAYQHRYVKAGHNILLIDYNRLITLDRLLPAGRLREPVNGRFRANTVVVTKCPYQLTPMEFRVVMETLKLRPFQQLFFSTFEYNCLVGLFNGKERPLRSLEAEEHVLLLTGIASPRQMMADLQRFTRHITPLSFPDHHYFSTEDCRRIDEAFRRISTPRLIITTEKDAARLRTTEGLSEMVRQALYALPIEVSIMRNEKEKFNTNISDYVRKNPRNG